MHDISIFFICDCSGSMSGKRIAALNSAVSHAIDNLKNTAPASPDINIQISAIKFSNDAVWHLHAPLENCHWLSIANTSGLTALGQAYTLLTEHLLAQSQDSNRLPPVIVLLSDGKPTDDADAALNKLLSCSWQGKQSKRYAIGIGNEADRCTLLNLTEQNSAAITIEAHAPEIRKATAYFTLAGLKASLFSRQGVRP